MADAGIEIGAHTYSHPDLGKLTDPAVLQRDLVAAREELRAALGRPVRYFSFPFGMHANLSCRAFALAAQCGYEGVCSAYGGYNYPGDDPFHLQRIPAVCEMLRMKNWLTCRPAEAPHAAVRVPLDWMHEDPHVDASDRSSCRPDRDGRGPCMLFCRKPLADLHDRGPLRVMFVITSMPVGGAETLLVELVRRLDRARFLPELCCLKELGPLGRNVGARRSPRITASCRERPTSACSGGWRGLMRRRRIDAVVTVGAGDKMFWGRLAARLAGVPVIASALHSTGWPDRVQFANRLLAPITDAFIAVAEPHGRYLAAHEGCPAAKIRVIPNGVDVERFRPRPPNGQLRKAFGLAADAPVVGIVAALRPEKNHRLFLRAAARVLQCRARRPFLSSATARNAANWKPWPARSAFPMPSVSWARGATCRRCCR